MAVYIVGYLLPVLVLDVDMTPCFVYFISYLLRLLHLDGLHLIFAAANNLTQVFSAYSLQTFHAGTRFPILSLFWKAESDNEKTGIQDAKEVEQTAGDKGLVLLQTLC